MGKKSRPFKPVKHDPNSVIGTKSRVDAGKVDLISDVLNLAIQKHARFDEVLGCLDLSQLADIEEITKYSPNLNTELWARVVVNEIKRRPTCSGLYLSKNKIRSLEQLATWMADGVQLDFISLEDNELRGVGDLPRLQPLKLKHLVLVGNPLYDVVDAEAIKQKLKLLATLQRIDSADMSRRSLVDKLPILRTRIDQPQNEAEGIVLNFMKGYFATAEQQGKKVDAMLDFYDTNAVLSFTTFPRLSLSLTGPGLVYSHKIQQNQHNVLQNTGTTASLFSGKLEVGKGLEMIHAAQLKFDPEPLTETEVTVISESVLEGARIKERLVTATMHGKITFSFVDVRSKKANTDGMDGPKMLGFPKYFDRTWVLTARNDKICILNDSLHIREMKAEPLPIYAPRKNQRFYSVHMFRQDNLVAQLSVRTGISPLYARKALEVAEVNWDVSLGEQWVAAQQVCGFVGRAGAARDCTFFSRFRLATDQ
eukprot:TRINITY_DN6368_c0_g1_i1.p1 TRINITY_DN6368_c0_g1~~TRINITY_DN6368_c0_g1_i1.p1  ORF type:complete len:480 (+),score=150.86 TRINITY_DN6368_c0_g1_i1:260-1699(+)